MSDIAKRLRASVRYDAINGNSFERGVCGKQMLSAAEYIESLQSQLAATSSALFQAQEAAKHQGERADGLQRIVDEARAQKPVCITTLDDFGTVVAYPPPNVLHSVPLYAAAHVPAQPSALTERWTQAQLDQLNSKASDLFKAATHKPLAEDVPAQPAVVPKHAADRIHEMRDVLFDIATSDVMGDRPEHAFVTVAIDRDTLSRAAILSDTEERKDE